MPYKDPAKQKEQHRRYYLAHQEEFKAKRKKYVKENREKVKACTKAWLKKHPEYNKQREARRRLDPIYRAKKREYSRQRESTPERKIWRREYQRNYMKIEANRIRLKTAQKNWAKKHPEKLAEYTRRWRIKNPEKHVARQLRYMRRHPDRIKAKEERWKKKPSYRIYLDRHAKDCRERYYRNPEIAKDKYRRRRARKVAATGHWTNKQWLIAKAYYGNKCLACGLSEQEIILLGRKLVPDHVRALARLGSNELSNIQPLCHGRDGCNNHKGTRYIDYRPKVMA